MPNYEKYNKVYNSVKDSVDAGFMIMPTFGLRTDDILNNAKKLGIEIMPEEINDFLAGLNLYFSRLGIATYGAESKLNENIIMFKRKEEEETKYEAFLDIYRSLETILGQYLSQYPEGYVVSRSSLINEIFKKIPRPKWKEIGIEPLLEGLQWFLTREGIIMKRRQIIIAATGDTEGEVIIFEKNIII